MSIHLPRRPVVAALLALAAVSQVAGAVRLRPSTPIYADSKGSGISTPEGVGCRGGDRLLVADSGNGRLLEFAVGPDIATPTAEISMAQLSFPLRVRIDSKGGILALDGKLRRIVRVGPSGEFGGYVDPAGVEGTVVPRSFAIGAGDELYILDVFSLRVLVLDGSGALQREIAFPEEHGFFSDVAVNAEGRVFLIDSVQRRVFSAGGNETVVAPWGDDLAAEAEFPTSIAVDGRGRLFVGDQSGGTILVLGTDGSFLGRQSSLGWKSGFLLYPSDLCVDEGNRLYVADRGNNRVQVFAIVD
jgi:DNA-binding beta-propeller fold protein YncE